ncbi:MAG: single-stranded DNA-binding protein [Candidatus Altiarchaeales archaeon]|nr:single-stranded DNA-binding protein [Candidatus Altiarchaeales archaeon]
MSHYVNSCVIGGYLVKRPDLKETQGGDPVCNFKVALNPPHRDEADYIDCVAWREAARSLHAYADKGQQITVTGEIETQNWKDRKGTIHKSTRVVVGKFSLGTRPRTAEAHVRKPIPRLPESRVEK